MQDPKKKQLFSIFGKIEDVRKNKSPIPFSNFLMSAFAMMHKNYDSFMRFKNDCAKEAEHRNLEKMYHIEHGIIPSANRTRPEFIIQKNVVVRIAVLKTKANQMSLIPMV